MLFTKIKVTQLKKSIQIHIFMLWYFKKYYDSRHMKISSCASSGHVRLFTSLLTKSYPDLAPNIPPDPPPDLGDEARPLRGIFTSSIKLKYCISS